MNLFFQSAAEPPNARVTPECEASCTCSPTPISIIGQGKMLMIIQATPQQSNPSPTQTVLLTKPSSIMYINHQPPLLSWMEARATLISTNYYSKIKTFQALQLWNNTILWMERAHRKIIQHASSTNVWFVNEDLLKASWCRSLFLGNYCL